MRTVVPDETVALPLAGEVYELPWASWLEPSGIEGAGASVDVSGPPALTVSLVRHASAKRATEVRVIGGAPGSTYPVTLSTLSRRGVLVFRQFVVYVGDSVPVVPVKTDAVEDTSVAGWRKKFETQG